jgi:hypothetical protein
MAEVIMTQTGDGERVIEPEGSARIFIRRRDPFGFWYVVFERGQTPESLSSAYTSNTYAKAAVEDYLRNSPVRTRAAKKATAE